MAIPAERCWKPHFISCKARQWSRFVSLIGFLLNCINTVATQPLGERAKTPHQLSNSDPIERCTASQTDTPSIWKCARLPLPLGVSTAPNQATDSSYFIHGAPRSQCLAIIFRTHASMCHVHIFVQVGMVENLEIRRLVH